MERVLHADARVSGMKRRERRGDIAAYAVLILLSAVWLLPFIYLVLQAFRGESTGMVNYILPREWSLRNFVSAYQIGVEDCMHDALWLVMDQFELFWGKCLVDSLSRLHYVKYKITGESDEDTL